MVVEACLTCWNRGDIVSMIYYNNTLWSSCLKLMTLLGNDSTFLGNDSLKFQT